MIIHTHLVHMVDKFALIARQLHMHVHSPLTTFTFTNSGVMDKLVYNITQVIMQLQSRIYCSYLVGVAYHIAA